MANIKIQKVTQEQIVYFAHELNKKKVGNDIDRLTYSLMEANIDLNPHQIEAALFALRSPLSKGVILADEVGLGKTIEAGLLLTQYFAEQKRRLLIICPASLRRQWALELEEKFRLPTQILEKTSHKEYEKRNMSPFIFEGVTIISFQYAGRIEKLLLAHRFDLCVIDEAHKLRNLYKKDNKLGRSIELSMWGTQKILLTATPLQNSLMELFGLSILIDPQIFGSEEAFKENYINGKINIKDLKDRLKNFVFRTLRKDVLEYIKYTNRSAYTMPFTPSVEEENLYNAVSDFILNHNGYAIPLAQRKLLVLVIRKLLASSSYAIIGTLQTIKARLEKLLKGDDDTEINITDLLDISAELLEEEEEKEEVVIPIPKEKINKEQLSGEIKQIEHYISLARLIKEETKAVKLVEGLKVAFKTKNKALIFTESHRTQKYLQEYLEQFPEFTGKICTFNGQNKEETSQKIYKKWLIDNEDTGLITGAKEVDLRQSLIDFFKDEAKIMIATEAASEGMNLQFCSLVVNYDLPWNPQRIEQRIGRCHRYGQKDDVVVINFLNKNNYADQRIYEILQSKFKLFDGVFGASDEILGTLEDGIDFEKSVLTILNTCRTKEEIEDAFNNLQTEMSEPITKRLDETKKILFENFDEDVHKRLKFHKEQAITRRNEMLDIFWVISKYILTNYFSDDFIGNYYFNDELKLFGTLKEEIALGHLPYDRKILSSFAYKLGEKLNDNQTKETNKYLLSKQEKKAEKLKPQTYRPSTPLGKRVLAKALTLRPVNNHITFDYSNYPAKITVLDRLKGTKGWLIATCLNIKSFSETEQIILSGIDEDGNLIHKETLEKLLNLDGVNSDFIACPHHDRLKRKNKEIKDDIVKELSQNNSVFFNEEIDKLDRWADDKRANLKSSLKKKDAEIADIKRQARNISDLEKKLELQKQVRNLDLKRYDLWKTHDAETSKILKEKDVVLDNIEKHLKQKISQEELFFISFDVI